MNQYQALMAGFATVVGVGGIATYNGVFSSPPAIVQTTQTNEKPAAAVNAIKPAKVEPAPVDIAKVDAVSAEPPKVESDTASALLALTAPTFDVLRVESNGSVLIAGKAEKDAQVEVLSGAGILGVTKAQPNGDFAIVIEKPLKPGDYQLVLRQTLADGTAATSIETATVSVPEKLNGPVLALVEEPGKPSRIITTPETAEVIDQPKPVNSQEVATPAEPSKPTDTQIAVQTNEAPAAVVEPVPSAVVAGMVNIEAVEVEGRTVFVAGVAKGVATVRVYANDIILGDTKPIVGDRFLLEIQRDLAAGDYIVKAEGLAADGVTVVGRSTVPFKGSNVETVAAAFAKEAAIADSLAGKKMAVIIRRGDTLWQISRRIYGRGIRYSTIYLANKDAVDNPNIIFPGQVMAIPVATPEGDAANAGEIEKREIAE